MTLQELVGQKLVIGIPGKRITSDIIAHFKELNAGGLILYRINFESPAQLKKLITDLETALERKLLIMADHEGGRVIMFREGVTVFPDNLAIGKTGKVEYAREQGEIESKELRRLGIDVNLSPVLDVLTDAYSPNIGIRAYGKDWKLVTKMGSARIRAMQKGGLSACAKHFPGKGHAPVDAHLGLPVIQSKWKEMEQIHLKPFVGAIVAGVDMVMSSHPYYPNLDSARGMIATFSRKIIQDCLRDRLKFKGIISSDDLEMGAIKAICPIGEAGVRASHAGHDILLVCHDLRAQKEVYDALLRAYKEKKLSLQELEKSADRIEKLKAKRPFRFEGKNPHPQPEGNKVAERICLESASILNPSSHPGKKRMINRKGKIVAIFPRLSSLSDKIMIEKEVLNEKLFLTREFRRYGVHPGIQIVSIEPTKDELKRCRTLVSLSETVIFFCYDAHLYSSNKQCLEIVQKSGKNVFVVLLRDPYDVEYIQKGAHCITGYGWRVCQIRAAINKIFSSK